MIITQTINPMPAAFFIPMNEKYFFLATCSRRTDKTFVNQSITWPNFLKKVCSPCRTPEMLEQYHRMSKEQQSALKDVGGYVAGYLQDGRRKKGYVLNRSMLTLDLDSAEPDTWAKIKRMCSFRCCVYSTRNHTPEKPRLRLVIPLAHNVMADEYEAVVRCLADQIGMAYFDPTTFQPERMMYWPSVSIDGVFFFDFIDGPDLSPDEYLAMYDDWRDKSAWPQHVQPDKPLGAQTKPPQPCGTTYEQQNPLEKPGVVGAFCRVYYPIQQAVETFLSDVYTPSATAGRYDYIPADSTAGVVIYDNQFVYSFHATDPLNSMLLNAFDLVRLHLYGYLDEEWIPDFPTEQPPSFRAMIAFALDDDDVRAELDAEILAEFDEIDDDNI